MVIACWQCGFLNPLLPLPIFPNDAWYHRVAIAELANVATILQQMFRAIVGYGLVMCIPRALFIKLVTDGRRRCALVMPQMAFPGRPAE